MMIMVVENRKWETGKRGNGNFSSGDDTGKDVYEKILQQWKNGKMEKRLNSIIHKGRRFDLLSYEYGVSGAQ